jgi:hypothetical protein
MPTLAGRDREGFIAGDLTMDTLLQSFGVRHHERERLIRAASADQELKVLLKDEGIDIFVIHRQDLLALSYICSSSEATIGSNDGFEVVFSYSLTNDRSFISSSVMSGTLALGSTTGCPVGLEAVPWNICDKEIHGELLLMIIACDSLIITLEVRYKWS